MIETILHAAIFRADCSSPSHQPQSKQRHKHLNLTTLSPREDFPEVDTAISSQEDIMAELPEIPVHPAQSVGFFRMSPTLSLARLEANEALLQISELQFTISSHVSSRSLRVSQRYSSSTPPPNPSSTRPLSTCQRMAYA